MKIFVSYRRDDTSGHVGRLADRLTARFGHDSVFRDIDSIAPGRDFAVAIDEAIGGSDAVIAVIGRQWLSARGANKGRRLDDPNDYVRLEIVAALDRNVPVIPLLFDGVPMPSVERLPAPLAPLARRNAIEVSDTRWDYDVQRLLDALDPMSPATLSGSVPVVAVPDARRRRQRLVVGSVVGVTLAIGLVIALIRGGGDPSGDVASGSPTSVLPTTTVASTTMLPTIPSTTTAPSSTAPRPTSLTTVSPQPTLPPPTVPTTTVTPTTVVLLPNADAVAGSWSGTASDGHGGTFRIVLDVKTGCTVGSKCGSVYVSGNECYGDFILYGIQGSTYEFNVNIRSGSGPNCGPGPGEYLSPQGSTLKYTTNYEAFGTLSRS